MLYSRVLTEGLKIRLKETYGPGVIENRQGRVVVKAPGGDWQTVLEGDVAALAWHVMASQTLTIVLKDGSLYTASAPAFNAQMMGYMEGVNQIWVPLP